MKKCSLCDNDKLEIVYTPTGSEIDLQICVCNFCGLVQGTYLADVYERINDTAHDPASKLTRLNCDAAYSNIRVGKQQMLSNAVHIINKNYNLTNNVQRVLDIRAARGDFVEYLHDLMPDIKIDAIETDQYMANQIKETPNIKVISSKYKSWLPTYKYDLVYSCHTLEHYREPKAHLKYIRDHLIDGGHLILDVPNIDIISKSSNFDEYFYDKHLSYFSKSTLKKMMSLVGYEAIEVYDAGACLYGLFRKIDTHETPNFDQTTVFSNKNLIKNYKNDIIDNRKSVGKICNKINNFTRKNEEGLCFWGIGRLYDVFNTYGNLATPQNTLLVDNYLSLATSEMYGRAIYDQQAITDDIKKIILFTRTSGLKEELSKLYPYLEVYHWSDFA